MSRQTEYLKRKVLEDPNKCYQSGCQKAKKEGHTYCEEHLRVRAGWAMVRYRRMLESKETVVRVEVNPLEEQRGM